MRQLIKQEFKKIFKKKYFLVLLLLLLGVSSYLTYTTYNNNYTGDNYIQDKQGVELTGIDAIRYIDDERHKLAGVVDEAFIKNYATSNENEINNFIENELVVDKDRMIANYGEDYEQLLNRAKKDELTDDDWFILDNNDAYWQEDMESGEIIPQIFYEDEGKLSAVYAIYQYAGDYFSVDSFMKDYKTSHEDDSYYSLGYYTASRFAPLVYKEKHLASQNENNDDIEYSFLNIYSGYDEEVVDTRIIDYYNERFMDVDPYYDSTIPNQYLIQNMSHPFGIILAMLLIILVLSDMFSYDRQTKVDQIVDCSSYGNKKLKVAKLIVGLCIALSVIIIQQAVIVLISNIILPVRDFSLYSITRDSIYTDSATINRFIETYGSIIFTGVLMLLLGGIVTSMLTMFISYLSKNKFITAISMILLIFASLFFVESYRFAGIISIVYPYIPIYFMRFTIFHNFVQSMPYALGIIPHTILFDNIVAVRDIVIVVWLVLCAGMGSFISFVKVGEVKSK